MKNLFLLAAAAIASLGFSSCCCLFADVGSNPQYTYEKKLVRYEYQAQEVATRGDSKSGKDGLTRVVQTKTPVYKTVKKRIRYSRCCVRPWTPDYGCCGSTGERTMRLSTTNAGGGSPNMGLVPTMKPLAP